MFQKDVKIWEYTVVLLHHTTQLHFNGKLFCQMQIKFNRSQATTIASVGDAISQPSALCKIALILGPPGTGKTYTLQGLVKAVLLEVRDNNQKKIVKTSFFHVDISTCYVTP